MEKEFNLSDEIIPIELINYIHIDKIKEFIRRLKKLLVDGNYYGDKSFTDLFKNIDKLSGSDLI